MLSARALSSRSTFNKTQGLQLVEAAESLVVGGAWQLLLEGSGRAVAAAPLPAAVEVAHSSCRGG